MNKFITPLIWSALLSSALFAQTADKTLEVRLLVLDPVFMVERNGFDEPAYFDAWKESGPSVFSDYSAVTVQVYRSKNGMKDALHFRRIDRIIRSAGIGGRSDIRRQICFMAAGPEGS